MQVETRSERSEEETLLIREVTDEMMNAALQEARSQTISMHDRMSQMVSFVWGNSLETERGTYESVCSDLRIDTEFLSR